MWGGSGVKKALLARPDGPPVRDDRSLTLAGRLGFK